MTDKDAKDFQKQIDKLRKEKRESDEINESHKRLNGKLRKELDEKNKDFNDLQKKLDDLKKSVEGRLEELRKKGLV